MSAAPGEAWASEVDVAIVGAGAAGLAAARHIRSLRPDLSILLLEAGSRWGGRARTVEAGPEHVPLDLGCAWLHGGRDNAWTVIAARTGFQIDRALAPWDGGHRTYDLEFAEQRDSEQALAAFFARVERRGEDEPDIPLSDLLEPGCRWNGLIGAMGTFINGVELDRASLRDYQRYEPGRGPDPRVREGYGTLIVSYGVGLPICLGTPVTRIDHAGKDLVLSTERGTIKARSAIVTVPTGALADESLRFDPPLPAKIAAAEALPLGIANKLFLAVPSGLQIPAEHHLLGTAHDPRTGTYHLRPYDLPYIECYFGGQLAHDLEREGETASVAFAKVELSRQLEPGLVERLKPLRSTAWAGEPHIHGSYSYARPGATGARAVLAAPVDDRLFFAGEACSPHRFSTAHGAYETGVAAAEAVVVTLAKHKGRGVSASLVR